jgi:glycosyltransferase involved in cell wall biosynthesis
MPHVSVVVPVFNAAAYIAGALRSVFAQTFTDFEVIVVDDGSDDHAALTRALAEFDGRIHYFRQPNSGPAKARNTGVAKATGELVAFLDADDEWLPEKLARQVKYFQDHPDTGLLHAAVVDGTPDSAIGGPPRHAFCELFHTDFFIRTLTVMMPRRVFTEAGGFDERREIHVEDWDLWLRIAARYPIGYVAEPLAYHRRGGLMSSQIDRTYEAQVLVMQKNRALCGDACARRRSEPGSCDRRRLHVLHRDWGHDLLQTGNPRSARKHLARALRLDPFDRWAVRLYLSTFASERWRTHARTLLARRRSGGDTSVDVASAAERISLVHDTTYRRFRRGLLRAVHDLDDSVSRKRHERKRVLFEAASPMSFTIFRPLYERLKNDPRIEIWYTASGSVWQAEQIFGRFGIFERVVDPSTVRWLKADVYMNADFWDMTWLQRRPRRIHLFHGVAGKYDLDRPIDLAPTIAAFDCLMFINDDRRHRYIDAGLVRDSPLAAPLIGYPKLDCLVDGSLDRAGIARALALDPSVPTVLYAPTWSPHSSLNTMGTDIIDGLAAKGLQVIVKLHDRSYDQGPRGAGGIDWAAHLERYGGHRLIRVATDADGSPFMAVSDAMVSDHSSIAFEYTLLNRPIVIADRPSLIEHARINPEKVHLLRRAASVAEDAQEVVRAVVRAIHRPEELSAERAHIAATLFYNPGTATERALAHVYRVLGLPAAVPDAIESAAGRSHVAVG